MRPFFTQALRLLLVFAAAAVCVSGILEGTAGLIGAAAGAGVALLDLGLLAVAAMAVGGRVGVIGAGGLGLLMSLKFPVLAVALYLLVVPLALAPVALMLGFGSLPAALVVGVLSGRLPMELRMRSEGSLG